VEHLLRATASAEARHFWFRGFRAFMLPLIRQAVHPPARVLDCGCGTGANVEMLSRFGHAFGFDLSPVGLRIGHQAHRTRLARARVTAAPFPDNAFDLVTSFDVLYSLEEPDERAAVSEMFRMTRPGGYALVNVAAMEMLRGDHSVLSREVRRYSRESLRALVAGAGFSIVRITYTNVSLFFPLAAIRLVQRWRGLAQEEQEQARREISVPWAPINTLLTGLLQLEAVWLRKFNSPFGSSLVCLARKPS
jgi:ubiquinone/menaquinone biosynthesis C-methylase UbiE